MDNRELFYRLLQRNRVQWDGRYVETLRTAFVSRCLFIRITVNMISSVCTVVKCRFTKSSSSCERACSRRAFATADLSMPGTWLDAIGRFGTVPVPWNIKFKNFHFYVHRTVLKSSSDGVYVWSQCRFWCDRYTSIQRTFGSTYAYTIRVAKKIFFAPRCAWPDSTVSVASKTALCLHRSRILKVAHTIYAPERAPVEKSAPCASYGINFSAYWATYI